VSGQHHISPCEIVWRGENPGVNELTPPDSHYLLAAQGWLELGDHLEADKELDEITPELRVHPDVLEIRWQIYAKEKKWLACLDIGLRVSVSKVSLPSIPQQQPAGLKSSGLFICAPGRAH
jgi:hypothetical protein